MLTKIQKWGNSLGLRIPRAFAREARVGPGATVDLTLKNGALVVRLVQGRSYDLASLLAGVTEGNMHAEIDTGGPVGREAW